MTKRKWLLNAEITTRDYIHFKYICIPLRELAETWFPETISISRCEAELEINDNTESITSASYLASLLFIGRDGQHHNSSYDKRDDLYFYIRDFLILSSNSPYSPA